MPQNNLKRMLDLVESVFAMRTDPEQLNVNEEVIEKLQTIHPATLSEMTNQDGPYAWLLIIPTSNETMYRFIDGKISEKEILAETVPQGKYEALYLCSVLVLPEFRHQGFASKLTLDALSKIKKDHPISSLYVWLFTDEGDRLAKKLSTVTGLPLFCRDHRKEK